MAAAARGYAQDPQGIQVQGFQGIEGHHPDFYIYYSKVVLELYTHAIKGLFDNDFILAAKIDDVLAKKARKAKD
jgi:pterin-4a-carbinolamine dehydratase